MKLQLAKLVACSSAVLVLLCLPICDPCVSIKSYLILHCVPILKVYTLCILSYCDWPWGSGGVSDGLARVRHRWFVAQGRQCPGRQWPSRRCTNNRWDHQGISKCLCNFGGCARGRLVQRWQMGGRQVRVATHTFSNDCTTSRPWDWRDDGRMCSTCQGGEKLAGIAGSCRNANNHQRCRQRCWCCARPERRAPKEQPARCRNMQAAMHNSHVGHCHQKGDNSTAHWPTWCCSFCFGMPAAEGTVAIAKPCRTIHQGSGRGEGKQSSRKDTIPCALKFEYFVIWNMFWCVWQRSQLHAC